LQSGTFQAKFLVQQVEEFWDGEVASGFQGHGGGALQANSTKQLL
jgi:hypothetical protein